jgi:hypothetical protein
MKLTPQQKLVYDHIKEFGKISPAHKGGTIYRCKMFGSETTKRCRELEAMGLITGYKNGRFVDYKLVNGAETGTPNPHRLTVRPVDYRLSI